MSLMSSSSERYDVGIIGAGVGGAFAALRIAQNYPSTKTIIFDFGRPPGKRRRQLEGWLGCFPAGDGKLYPGDFEKVLDLVDGRKAKPASKWVIDTLGEVNPMKLITDHLPNAATQKRIKDAGFELKKNNYYQWKPESIHQLSRLISEQIEKTSNITFSFDNEVHKIIKKKGVFLVSSSNGEFACKKIIMCVGRSGWRWANNIYKELGISVNDNYATFGVRLEMSAQYLKDFNKSHCTLVRDKIEVGPFSWYGSVIPEDHADLVISAFRSNEERWKSDKVSFSLFGSHYYKDKGCFESERLGKLAFILFNDRVSRERVKIFMKDSSQLSLLPEYVWLKSVLPELESIIPNLISRGYLHVPNILPMASEIRLGTNLESEVDGFFVAGESAGVRGIAAAAAMGAICADSICR